MLEFGNRVDTEGTCWSLGTEYIQKVHVGVWEQSRYRRYMLEFGNRVDTEGTCWSLGTK